VEIRKVRNEFAHEVHAPFDGDRIRNLCARLTMAAEPQGNEKINARGQFTTAAVALIVALTHRAHHVSEKRCTYERVASAKEWPR
jgi:mannitol operon repressor